MVSPSNIKGNFLRTKTQDGMASALGSPDKDKGHGIGSGAQCGLPIMSMKIIS